MTFDDGYGADPTEPLSYAFESIAPVPEAVKSATEPVVRQTSDRRGSTRSSTARNSGPRWYTIGRAMASSTSGGIGVGPGVIR